MLAIVILLLARCRAKVPELEMNRTASSLEETRGKGRHGQNVLLIAAGRGAL